MTWNVNIKTAFLVCALFFSGLSMAATESEKPAAVTPEDPIKLLKGITDNVLQALKRNQTELQANPNKIYSIVDRFILPHVDFNEMSLWVAGRSAWGKAPDRTKDKFVSEFKVLVVRTYATALNKYTNETVYFAPQKINTSKERIQVTSSITRTNKENMRVDYRLIKHEDTWLVYDIIIEGVSILQGFQAQFTDEIRHKGIDQVIAQIKEHNRKTET